jgi:hypothetical protein
VPTSKVTLGQNVKEHITGVFFECHRLFHVKGLIFLSV